MKNKNLTEQSFTQGAAVLLISTVLVKLIGAFFKIPLSADYCLGRLGFGYFSYSYDIYIPIYTIASSGFPVAIAKIMSDYMAVGKIKQAQSAFKLFLRIMLLLGVSGFLTICVFTKPLVSVSDNTANTAYIMFAMAPAVIFCCLSSVYRGAFEGYRNMTPTAISNIIEALSKVLFGFFAAFITVKLTDNLAYAAAAAMAGITLGTAISFIFLKIAYTNKIKKSVEENPVIEKGLLKKLIAISLPIVFSSLAGSIISLIDALTVNWRLYDLIGENFTELSRCIDSAVGITADTLPAFLYGLRSQAYTLFHLVPTFISALAISALPTITSYFSSHKMDKVSENSNVLLKFSAVVTFPLSLGMIFIGQPGNNSPLAGGIMLSLYGLAAIGAGISMALTAILQSCGKQNTAFINFAVGIVLKLVFNLILVGIVDVNIYGSVISTVICYLYVMIAHLISLRKCGLKLNYKGSMLKPFVAAIPCGFSAFLVCMLSDSKIAVLIAVFLAAVIYLALLLLQKTFCKSDFSGLAFGEKLIKILKIH